MTSHNDESQYSKNANALPDNKYIPIYEVRPVKLPGQPAKKKLVTMLRWAIKPEINSPVFHLFLTWSHCHADQNTDDQSLLHSTCATVVFLCLKEQVFSCLQQS